MERRDREPRLMIYKLVLENFKSYAGVRTVGPFHKVCQMSCVTAIEFYLFHVVVLFSRRRTKRQW